MDESTKVITVKDVYKSYQLSKNAPLIPVLNGVNFEIHKRDFAIIYGSSGSGKSTILHHVVGLEVPSKGKIFIDDKDITVLSDEERGILRAKKIGMVYQVCYWIKSLLVWENVAMPLLIIGYPPKVAKDKAFYALEQISMEKYSYKYPVQLSGGEQQRIGLARAIINDPEIVIADEPTGNLDTVSAKGIMDYLQFMNKRQGRTIVMVTHNLSYLALASRTIAMKDGKVVSAESQEIQNMIKQRQI
ncbi:MAG: ABC transporter ATP-binding protein [Patescibacteria group bacterium]|nr:ABC transporter ATP-binding protein [Patescibacteria group bacterium]